MDGQLPHVSSLSDLLPALEQANYELIESRSGPVTFRQVLVRLFTAAAMTGAVSTILWLIFVRLPHSLGSGAMAVLVVSGGTQLTYWINKKWLRFVAANPLRLSRLANWSLQTTGGAMFVVGWFFFISAMLDPANNPTRSFSHAKSAAKGNEEWSGKGEQTSEEAIPEQILWPLVNGACASICVVLIYGGAMAMNAAKRSKVAHLPQLDVGDVKNQIVYSAHSRPTRHQQHRKECCAASPCGPRRSCSQMPSTFAESAFSPLEGLGNLCQS